MGFDGTRVDDPMVKEFLDSARKGILGGIVLYAKNIENPLQLQTLVQAFKEASPNIIVAVDQEGGKIERLTEEKGFFDTPSAKVVSEKLSPQEAQEIFQKMAYMLHENGINLNLAPVIDLTPSGYECPVISALDRSYSTSAQKVADYALAFIKGHKTANVLTVLKHFPGHGYVKNDSHIEFVDATNTFNTVEIEPFNILIKNNNIENCAIMTAHVFNKNFDIKYPATLSPKTIAYLRGKNMQYKGVIITDDLEMGAIWKQYTLDKIIQLAVNAGNDLLLFSNNSPIVHERLYPSTIVKIVLDLVKDGKIKLENITVSHERIKYFLTQLEQNN